MKKLYSITVLLLSALIIFAGCSAKNFDQAAENGFLYFDMAETESIVAEDSGFSGYTDGNYKNYSVESPMEPVVEEKEKQIEVSAQSRKIIYTSSFDIKTTEFETAVSVLNKLCDKYGAYFESSETYGTKENANRHSSYKVRVPVDNYNLFKNSAGDIGVILRSSENNEDVTERYFDTEARLSSAKIREERLLAILATATSLDNVLLLEAELAEVRYEIESMSGTLRKYDSLVSYSTISINIQEVTEPVEVKIAPRTFGQKIASALSDGFENFTDFLEALVLTISYNLPGIIIFIIVVIIIVVVIRKSVKKARKAIEATGAKESDSDNK